MEGIQVVSNFCYYEIYLNKIFMSVFLCTFCEYKILKSSIRIKGKEYFSTL